MSTYTDGPWKVSWMNGIPIQILGKGTEKNPIYNPVTRERTTFIGPTTDEAKANAMLIAAAPELLECLIHLMDRDWFRDGVTGRSVTCSLNPDKVRRALNKATGKESS